MKKNSAIKSQHNIHKLLAGLTLYSIFIALFYSYAIHNLDKVYSQAHGGWTAPTTEEFIYTFAICGALYLIRCLVLLLPKIIAIWKKDIHSGGWIYGGILASIPLELYLISSIMDLATKTTCEQNGDFDCGWDGWGVGVGLFLACGAQILGMLVGGIVQFIIDRRRK
jgi:hypothetical protein